MSEAVIHRPVLLDEVLSRLDPRPGDFAVDATLGAGGHALELLRRIAPGGRLVGVDRDPEMLEIARQRLAAEAPEGAQWTLLRGNAADLPELLASAGLSQNFDLFLCDCGLCSVHYDQADRGFSMKRSGPLDMRLDRSGDGLTAADVVNRASERDLSRVVAILGEEPNARRVARAIVRRRDERPFETTEDLAELVRSCYPAKFRGGRRDPATRTFQALRVWLNEELESLVRLVRAALEGLAIGGRAAFIAFHSLEDRIIKRALAAAARETFATARDAMMGRGNRALEVKKRVAASPVEVEANPRARSASLRVCRKVAPIPADADWPKPPAVAEIAAAL
jgi:16S rRNA (cytosine1402-N4)-methyltransferase